MIAATFTRKAMGTFEQARDFFMQGLAHYQAGRWGAADQNFTAALSLAPGRPSVLTNLGATRLKLGKFQEAADLLEEALAQEPDNAEALGHRATALAELGQLPQAVACVERALAIAPGVGAAWGLRGNLMKELGRVDEAITSFRNAIERGADNELNRYCLAALTGQGAPLNAPKQYVQSLFDGYAQGFDAHLVEVLRYRAPQVLLEGLKRSGRSFERALDLGCGTGLCGPLMRPLAATLDAVDLSANMVARASALGVYDDVVQADVAQYLADTPHRYDLVLAADVFIYVGALEAVFAGAAHVLQPQGVFCFSVEAAPTGEDLALRPSMRYAHSRSYIEKLATANGLVVTEVVEQPIREDQRVPIEGLYFWLRR
ncbi:MAG: tetratricopeptide repeat protein [Ramlibacter sp.]